MRAQRLNSVVEDVIVEVVTCVQVETSVVAVEDVGRLVVRESVDDVASVVVGESVDVSVVEAETEVVDDCDVPVDVVVVGGFDVELAMVSVVEVGIEVVRLSVDVNPKDDETDAVEDVVMVLLDSVVVCDVVRVELSTGLNLTAPAVIMFEVAPATAKKRISVNTICMETGFLGLTPTSGITSNLSFHLSLRSPRDPSNYR